MVPSRVKSRVLSEYSLKVGLQGRVLSEYTLQGGRPPRDRLATFATMILGQQEHINKQNPCSLP